MTCRSACGRSSAIEPRGLAACLAYRGDAIPHRAILLGLTVMLSMFAGCASGEIYWTRPGATEATFLSDHTPCFKTAYVGYGIGNEQAYKACMRSKGWTRVQGTGSQPPDVPYFRGPEADDEFKDTGETCEHWRERWRTGYDRHRPPPSDCSR